MTPLTKNLSEEELACHDGTPYPFDEPDSDGPMAGLTWRETRAEPLGQLFEAIRLYTGDVPITVDSAYRTLEYDEKLYEADRGAGNVATPQGSQHPKGRALDLKHSELSPLSFFNAILRAYEVGQTAAAGEPERTIYLLLGGVGLYPSFCHIDIAPRPPSNHLRIWGGTRPSNIV